MNREKISENLKSKLHDEEWLIWQEQYEAKENLKYESLFALSNGYLGIRGSMKKAQNHTAISLYQWSI